MDSDRPIEASVLSEMMKTIAHRGPDGEGAYIHRNVGLGFRRLSIIDLQTGQQPMPNEDETVWIVFNGEVYNYLELREHLQQKGHRFRTRTDTESIIHLYEEYGPECVTRLRGMFAFAIWDERKRQLLLARDRLGEKPLFYYQDNERFLFASEIKALLADPGLDIEMNPAGLDSYLSLRFILAPHTMFRHIYKLPPAHYLIFRDGQVRINKYWEPSFLPKIRARKDEIMERLRDLMLESIQIRLMSDVPLGAFLSGGIDSSLVVAFMSQASTPEPETFSIGVDDADYNELPYARAVAEKYNTKHNEFIIRPNVVESLPKIVELMDEPTDPFALSVYYISGAARRHVTVALGGDGGDEVFGGYDRYLGNQFMRLLLKLPKVFRQHVFTPLIEMIPEDFSRKSLAQKLRWLNRMSSYPDDSRYFESMSFFRFNDDSKSFLYSDDLKASLNGSHLVEHVFKFFQSPVAENLVDRMLYTDMMTRLPDYTLLILDRMSMAHGLEARSPYLDHGLVEFACSIPERYKVRGKQLKWILRELARDYLPPQILTRDKQGFGFPLNRWLKNDLREFINDIFHSSQMIRDGYFNSEYVLRLIREHQEGRVDHQMRIWCILNVELWYRAFFGSRKRATLAV